MATNENSEPKALAPKRTYWHAFDLGIANEPLLLSLLKYRQRKNRIRVEKDDANLISSKTTRGKHMPIIDLDYNFAVVDSSTQGHQHLYLNVEISRLKFTVLMLALWFAGVVETGYAVWSLRRGGNFVRMPGVVKQPGAETDKPAYGWLFKMKDPK